MLLCIMANELALKISLQYYNFGIFFVFMIVLLFVFVVRMGSNVVFGNDQQAKQGKVPDELVERLHGILGHIMRPNTLKVDLHI